MAPDNAAAITRHFRSCLSASAAQARPWRHWLLSDALPAGVCDAIAALPFAPPAIDDTLGKRETHNASRIYFSPEQQARFDVCAQVATAFQNPAAVAALEQKCGTQLDGTSLRIEYCLDTDGFWLEPHTDIGAKKFTMLVYLSNEPEAADWGTDVYDGPQHWAGSAPYRRNAGLIFIPGADTWHGFRKRPIQGVRKSIIVNYVGPEWRSRHELAYPDQPARNSR